MDVAGVATLSWLLDQALDRAPAERLPWVDSLGPEYDAVRPKLRRLLETPLSDVFDGALQTLPKTTTASVTQPPGVDHPGVAPGSLVGPYRIVRPLAEGGMGTVWLAEREDGLVNRPVALKLPRGGWNRVVLAERMAREREFLAALAHPHIARLYDAGVTADGQPYLAIEHVEGRPLDVHLRETSPDIAARLRLFLQIARAVAYAHSKLIVHRDLKPGNVLITSEGYVRLLDFGVAKLLDETRSGPALTEVAGAALTPEYASPEQITGAPIGVASDVYSLGVVLYEMLTGVRPYAVAGGSRRALEDAVLAAEIRRPSAVTDAPARRALTGDLDTIVLKALEREPGDRYLTVDGFADDVQRHLDGHPVHARPDTSWYRARKFVARHRLGVGAAAMVAVAVLVGAGVAVWQAGVAREEQRRAQAEQRRAEDVKQFIASIFDDADPYRRGGANVKAVDLLTQARRRLDGLPGEQTSSRVELLTILGGSLLRLQNIADAEAAVLQAVDEGRARLGDEHPLTLSARLLLVDVHRYRGRVTEMRQELDLLEPTFRRRGGEYDRQLIGALEFRSHMALDAGDYAASEAAAADALRRAEVTLGPRDPKTVQIAMMLAQTYQFGVPRPEQALTAAARAMQMATDLHPDEPTYPQVVDMRHIYARALGGAGHFAKGIEELERAIRDASATVGPNGQKVAFMRSNLARIQRRAGRLADALTNHVASREVLGKQFKLDSWSYLGGVVSQGQSFLAARDAASARRDLQLSVEGLTRTMGPGHQQVMTARHNLELARAYLGEATSAAEALSALLRDYAPADAAMLAPPLLSLGTAERLAGRPMAALASLDRARMHFGEGPAAALDRLHVDTERGLALLDLRRFDEARATLAVAVEGYATVQIAPTPARAEALAGLARSLAALKRPTEADPLLAEAETFWRSFEPRHPAAAELARVRRSLVPRASTAAGVSGFPG